MVKLFLSSVEAIHQDERGSLIIATFGVEEVSRKHGVLIGDLHPFNLDEQG